MKWHNGRQPLMMLAVMTLMVGPLFAAPGPPAPGPSQSQPPAPMVPAAKPDLTVQIQQVFCSVHNGVHNVQVKLRVQNSSSNKTWKDVWTQVLLDSPDPAVGTPFIDTPYVVTQPLFGGQGNVKHRNLQTTAGTHTIFVKTDWSNQQPETNEGNNTAVKKITVPNGC